MMTNTNKFVFAYHGTYNLGDAIQTYALTRLLPQPIACMYRHKMHQIKRDEMVVANGYLCDEPYQNEKTLFAGIYVGGSHDSYLKWIKKSPFKVGARDPFTVKYLKDRGITSEMVGCATTTLPRYVGARSGILSIDDGRNCPVTQDCSTVNWCSQWQMAIGSLEMMKRAALVVTKRLHVALPCLAMGTPVYIDSSVESEVLAPKRFSLLLEMGFKFNEAMSIDISPFAQKYVEFLSEGIGEAVVPREFPEMPCPLSIIPSGVYGSR
jgi:hypothetical protein